MSAEVVSKVTAFITREADEVRQLLVFQHPNAGIQLPGGTMEAGETPEIAMLREVQEETALTAVEIVAHLATIDHTLAGGLEVLIEPYTLDLSPKGAKSEIALTRGYPVQIVRSEGQYVYVCYDFTMEDRVFHADLDKMGWIPRRLLTAATRRYLFQLRPTAATPDRWSNLADFGHTFDLYWTVLDVQLVAPQQPWLDLVRDRLRFSEKE